MATPTMFGISRQDLSSLDIPPDAHITDVEHLASYNWIETLSPTIAVPGSPPIWSNIKLPKQLNKDSGLVYIAQNAARHPESPLEPLFRALDIERPGFDIRDVQIVSDRNNIRKLLSFIDPGISRDGLQEFTIKVEVVGETAILCRDETLVQEFIGPNEFRGFGREFEKVFTKNQIEGSTGHHRIITYRFGTLQLVVRYETDAAVQTPNHRADLAGMMEDLSLNKDNPDPSVAPATQSRLTIMRAGQAVPISTTLEIKTRVAHKPMQFDEIAPQLWVSQTPNLVRAYHTKGVFGVPNVEDVAADLKRWEERNQMSLRVLTALLRKIVEVGKMYGHAEIKYDAAQDRLIIRQVGAKKMLPQDVYVRWEKPEPLHTPVKSGGIVSSTEENSSMDEETTTNPDDNKTAIRIGSMLYRVPLENFPYLHRFVESKRLESPPATEFQHDEIDFFDLALKGSISGYRQCLRYSIDNNVDAFKELCNTYDLLEVDILEGQSLNDIITNIKAGKSDFSYHEVRGNSRLARDSAFRLIYFILNGEHDRSDANNIYHAVMYVVAHPGTFRYNTRTIVREAYLREVMYSAKQREALDRWNTYRGPRDDEGSTTASSDSSVFDSDEV